MSYFVSWSGGKDSCLALCHAYKRFGKPKFLLCMLNEKGNNSRSHGLSRRDLQNQAKAFDIPILFFSSSWKNYENKFSEALEQLKNKNISTGVFGDLKIFQKPNWTSHLEWAQNICSKYNIKAYEPLWNYSHSELFDSYFSSRITAKIISVNTKYLETDLLGKTFDKPLALKLMEEGIDPFGEKGEFHTFVVNCPYFSNEIKTENLGFENTANYKRLKIKTRLQIDQVYGPNN